jgi:hypothetical protein
MDAFGARGKIMKKILMKSNLILIILSIVLFTCPFMLYFLVFNSGFSNDNNSWGNFGSYIGGLISSVFSFASLLAVLYSFNRSNKDKLVSDEEKMIFKYVDLIKESRNNLFCKTSETQEYKGMELVSAYSASYANISMINSEYKKRGTSILNITKTPQYYGYYVNHMFLTTSIESFMTIIKLSYIYILHLKEVNQHYYLELISAVLTNQDKMAFMYYNFDFIEANSILQKYIYHDDNQKVGIKNMINSTTEYLQAFVERNK